MTLTLTTTLALSCAPVMVQSGGFSLSKNALDLDFDFVRNRAAFDLSCPKEALSLVVLNTQGPTYPQLAMEIGATGCEKRAAYVARPGGWALNSPISTVEKPAATTP